MIAASRLRFFLLLGTLSLTLSLIGCSSATAVKIKGKIVPPKGFTIEKDDFVTVALMPVELASTTTSGESKVDTSSLTFMIEGNEKKGIAPGKYRVFVTCQPYMGTPGTEARKKVMDKAFEPFSAMKTPLTVEVTKDPEQTITVDLAAKSVSK